VIGISLVLLGDRLFNHIATATAAAAGGECDASCDTDGELRCWGAGPDMCQTRKKL